MKRLSLALAASLIGVAPTAGAVDLLTDFTISSAISSIGLTGEPGNVVRELTIPAGHTVIGFGWDVQLAAFDPSWFSEMQVVFGANNFTLSPGFWDPDENGTGSGTLGFSSGRIFSIQEMGGTPFTIGPTGKLRMEFSEEYDDDAPTPDGRWLSGTLTVVTAVPEPGTYGLMALGMLGIAAAVWRRRT